MFNASALTDYGRHCVPHRNTISRSLVRIRRVDLLKLDESAIVELR